MYERCKGASRAWEIFESSEVNEKRQLLNLVFQNLQLRDVGLSVQVTEPFKTMVDYKECPTNWRWRESNCREIALVRKICVISRKVKGTSRLPQKTCVMLKPIVYDGNDLIDGFRLFFSPFFIHSFHISSPESL